eukprot:TRINITY_DN8349_c0_g1_i1.p1 TRINITY_DN8349_c0_g1~~TRINITY_DN8349_c0_g1_i1.p1  ORF type:complete len:534 (+),score=117.97 TRINITY_DN8349_c0_g1_i1:62-1663(+)
MGIAAELRDLFDLHRHGALTENEFKEAKKAVLMGKVDLDTRSSPTGERVQVAPLRAHTTPFTDGVKDYYSGNNNNNNNINTNTSYLGNINNDNENNHSYGYKSTKLGIDVITPPLPSSLSLPHQGVVAEDASLEGCVALANEAVLLAINAFDQQTHSETVQQPPPPTMLPPPLSPVDPIPVTTADDIETVVRRVPLSIPLMEKLEASPVQAIPVPPPSIPPLTRSNGVSLMSSFEERIKERKLIEHQIELERQRSRELERMRLEREKEIVPTAVVSVHSLDETIPFQSERVVSFSGERSASLADRMLAREREVRQSGGLMSPKGTSSTPALEFQLTSPTPDRKDVAPPHRSIELYSPPPSGDSELLRWDPRLSRGVHLSDDGREAMCVGDSGGHVVVGTTPFDPTVHTSFMWSVVLMLRRASSTDILVGMTGRGESGKASFALRGDGCVVSEHHDGLSVGHHYSSPLGSDKSVTTVCISCRIEESALSFTVDGTDLGKAFDFPQGLTFYPMVVLGQEGEAALLPRADNGLMAS